MKFIYVKVIIIIIAVENAVFNGATAEHKSSAEQIARIRLFSFIVTAELLLGSFLLIRTFHSGKRTSMSSCCSHRIVSVATIHPEIASIVDSERIEDGTLRSRGSELCQKSFLKFYWDVLNITAYLDYTPPQCSRGYYQRFETVTNSPRSHPETNRDACQPLPDDGVLESFEKGDLSPPSTLQQLLPAVLQPSGSSELPVMVSSRLETTDFLVGRSDKGTLAATSLDN